MATAVHPTEPHPGPIDTPAQADTLPISLQDFPLLPHGELLWSDAAANIVDLAAVAPRLPNCLVILSGPSRHGAAVIVDGTVVDAVWVDRRRAVAGDAALRALTASTTGTVAGYAIDDRRLLDAVPLLWRCPRLVSALPAEWLDADKLVRSIRTEGRSCALLIHSSVRAVALFSAGDLVGSYTEKRLRPSSTTATLRALLRTAGTQVTVVASRDSAALLVAPPAVEDGEPEPHEEVGDGTATAELLPTPAANAEPAEELGLAEAVGTTEPAAEAPAAAAEEAVPIDDLGDTDATAVLSAVHDGTAEQVPVTEDTVVEDTVEATAQADADPDADPELEASLSDPAPSPWGAAEDTAEQLDSSDSVAADWADLVFTESASEASTPAHAAVPTWSVRGADDDVSPLSLPSAMDDLANEATTNGNGHAHGNGADADAGVPASAPESFLSEDDDLDAPVAERVLLRFPPDPLELPELAPEATAEPTAPNGVWATEGAPGESYSDPLTFHVMAPPPASQPATDDLTFAELSPPPAPSAPSTNGWHADVLDDVPAAQTLDASTAADQDSEPGNDAVEMAAAVEATAPMDTWADVVVSEPSTASDGAPVAAATEEPAAAEPFADELFDDFVPTRLDIDIDGLRQELIDIATVWLGADDIAPAADLIRRARPGVDEFVAAIAAVGALQIPGHEAAVVRAMAREMHFRAAEVLCGV